MSPVIIKDFLITGETDEWCSLFSLYLLL